ncbi:hypothetical protein FTO70_10255 [Methanosarcina sp. KYL-1]|uniref:prenylated flavin chaperone LpdD n=1 Tax=Methanosarcina sp. KYL-1 TaxID=2602068 RepID=UPI00210165A6|nr:hypothetical protein [Methanosarcina sp. KYL-1]MCQ1536054.1 hypothetical protein [Methanosarcina sp. KYL-1]
MFQITRKVGRIELLLDAKKLGDDYLLTLTGGKEHAGAVAVGLFDEKSQRASSSVICLPGHREEQLALQGARLVSRATRGTSVFVAGIHLDDISPEEIREIVSISGEMIEKFIAFCEKANKTEEREE